MHPDVLSAVLDANIQRVKSNEQRVREWELRMEVERRRAKERQGERKDLKIDGQHSGQNVLDVGVGSKAHQARDLAAKACGLDFSGRHIQDAAKAIQSGDLLATMGVSFSVDYGPPP